MDPVIQIMILITVHSMNHAHLSCPHHSHAMVLQGGEARLRVMSMEGRFTAPAMGTRLPLQGQEQEEGTVLPKALAMHSERVTEPGKTPWRCMNRGFHKLHMLH